jgi:hypothetical protein
MAGASFTARVFSAPMTRFASTARVGRTVDSPSGRSDSRQIRPAPLRSQVSRAIVQPSCFLPPDSTLYTISATSDLKSDRRDGPAFAISSAIKPRSESLAYPMWIWASAAIKRLIASRSFA